VVSVKTADFLESSITLLLSIDDATSCFFKQSPVASDSPSIEGLMIESVDDSGFSKPDGERISGDDKDIWSLDLLQEDPGYLPPQISWERYQHRRMQNSSQARDEAVIE
jgi:hypothetical protein